MPVIIGRRELVGGLGCAAVAWPLASRAQQEQKIRRIGIIDDTPIWDHFRSALRDLGHVEGKTIAYEYRTAEGEPERLAVAAAELVHLPVDVIAVYGTAPALAAMAATKSIPIVAFSVGTSAPNGRSCSKRSSLVLRGWPFSGIPTTPRMSPTARSCAPRHRHWECK